MMATTCQYNLWNNVFYMENSLGFAFIIKKNLTIQVDKLIWQDVDCEVAQI